MSQNHMIKELTTLYTIGDREKLLKKNHKT